ncbi:hypothetical protein AAG906_029105 [Vitis piasezkii]
MLRTFAIISNQFVLSFGVLIAFDHQSNSRLRRVIWNPWQSNGKLKNMKNQSFEVLCHKQIRNARRGIMSAIFGALSEGQFMHAICHFEAQECCEITLLLRNDFAAFLHSAVEFLLKFPDICDTLEAEHRKLKADFAALRDYFWTPRRYPLVISCELLTSNPRLKITLNGKCYVINFVDYSLNQGVPARHESAETPIGHESSTMSKKVAKLGFSQTIFSK